MGKKPSSSARDLFWVGLTLACLAGLGCSGSGPRKPIAPGGIRENPYARPAGFGKTTGNPPSGPGGPGGGVFPPATLSGAGTTDPLKTGPLPSRSPTIMKTSGTTAPSGPGGFNQGSKLPASALPGNTDSGTGPLGSIEGLNNTSTTALPPMPPAPPMPTTGRELSNFASQKPSNLPSPIATGNQLLPPPPMPPAPPAIPGTALTPVSGTTALPPLSGAGVGSTSAYQPTTRMTTTTTAPPENYPSQPYPTQPGYVPGEVLPPVIESNR